MKQIIFRRLALNPHIIYLLLFVKNSYTALMLASESGREEVAKVLLQNGASVNFRNNVRSFKYWPTPWYVLHGKSC